MNYIEQLHLYNYKVDTRAKLCEYDLLGNYGIGYTTQGDVFYFDKDDYDLIKDYPWHKAVKTDYMYAYVRIDGKRPYVLMHRLIMNAPKGLFVDHIGGSETRNDNRRCNLRLVTPAQNIWNMKPPRDCEKGVRFHYGKWESVIRANKSTIYLGTFDTYKEAVKARRDAEEKYHGEYSYKKSQEVSEKWRVQSV